MPKPEAEQALRERQLAAIVDTLARKPGMTAYMLGAFIPVPQPSVAQQLATGLLAVSAPPAQTLALLKELERARKVRHDDDPKGNRWYPVDSTASCGPLSDCARNGYVDRLPGQSLTDHIGAAEAGPA